MAASIYTKNRNGKVQYYVRYRQSSKDKWISCGSVPNKREADALVTRINYAELTDDKEVLMDLIGSQKLNQQVRKESILSDNLANFKLPFEDLASEFLATKSTSAKSTYVSYEAIFNNPLLKKHFEGIEIGSITTEMITAYMNDIINHPFSESHSANLLRYPRYALNYALEMGYIYKHPYKRIHNIQTHRTVLDYVLWSPEQLQAYLKFVANEEPRMLAPLAIGATTGMRKSEMIGLHYSDFDHVRKTLTIRRSVTGFSKGEFHIGKPKTHSSARVVELDPSTYKILMNHVTQQEHFLWRDYKVMPTADTPLICGSGPEYIKPDRVQSNHKRLQELFAEKSDIRLPYTRYKDLRDTFATHALESKKMEEIQISRRMGHKNEMITRQRYQHITTRVVGTSVVDVAGYQLGDFEYNAKAWNKEIEASQLRELNSEN